MEKTVELMEKFARFTYKWIATEDEILGEIIYTLHTFGSLTLLTLIGVSHTIYPVFWFQFAIFCVIFCVWIQHILLKTCIITCLESKFIKNHNRVMLIDGLLKLLGMPVTPETQTGVMLLWSTGSLIFLGLELVARSVMYGRTMLGASVWI